MGVVRAGIRRDGTRSTTAAVLQLFRLNPSPHPYTTCHPTQHQPAPKWAHRMSRMLTLLSWTVPLPSAASMMMGPALLPHQFSQ